MNKSKASSRDKPPLPNGKVGIPIISSLSKDLSNGISATTGIPILNLHGPDSGPTNVMAWRDSIREASFERFKELGHIFTTESYYSHPSPVNPIHLWKQEQKNMYFNLVAQACEKKRRTFKKSHPHPAAKLSEAEKAAKTDEELLRLKEAIASWDKELEDAIEIAKLRIPQ
eukprot:gene20426-24370_t